MVFAKAILVVIPLLLIAITVVGAKMVLNTNRSFDERSRAYSPDAKTGRGGETGEIPTGIVISKTVCPDPTVPLPGCDYYGGDGIAQAISGFNQPGNTLLVRLRSTAINSSSEYWPTQEMTVRNNNILVSGEGNRKPVIVVNNVRGAHYLTAGVGSSLRLNNIRIEGGMNNKSSLLRVENAGKLELVSSEIANTKIGVLGIEGTVRLTDNLFQGNNMAVQIQYFDRVQHNSLLRNNVFLSNGGGLRAGCYYANTDDLSVQNNVFFTNSSVSSPQLSLHVGSEPCRSLSVNNNIFKGTQNIGNGLFIEFSNPNPVPTVLGAIKYNNAFGFQSNFLLNGSGSGQMDPTNISVNPKFVGEPSNFRLAANSPLINAGNPEQMYLDTDGSRNDMGVYGGPFGSYFGNWGSPATCNLCDLDDDNLVEGGNATPRGDDINRVIACLGQRVATNPSCAKADFTADGLLINSGDVTSFVGLCNGMQGRSCSSAICSAPNIPGQRADTDLNKDYVVNNIDVAIFDNSLCSGIASLSGQVWKYCRMFDINGDYQVDQVDRQMVSSCVGQ